MTWLWPHCGTHAQCAWWHDSVVPGSADVTAVAFAGSYAVGEAQCNNACRMNSYAKRGALESAAVIQQNLYELGNITDSGAVSWAAAKAVASGLYDVYLRTRSDFTSPPLGFGGATRFVRLRMPWRRFCLLSLPVVWLPCDPTPIAVLTLRLDAAHSVRLVSLCYCSHAGASCVYPAGHQLPLLRGPRLRVCPRRWRRGSHVAGQPGAVR